MTVFTAALLFTNLQGAEARPYHYQAPVRVYPVYPPTPYYPQAYYPYPGYASPQAQVIVIPRQGINDSFYQYDNIYGPEASAAGRMGHHVVTPPPRLYFY